MKNLINQKLQMDSLVLLAQIQDKTIKTCFFDPQYRGILDKMKYGNEGKRQVERVSLQQMSEEYITSLIFEINRVLLSSGHLFLWVDKFHLCEGIKHWLVDTSLNIVDLITWNKMTFGMGYRSRRCSEYLLVLQKEPIKAKNHWTKHNIRDVWDEKIITRIHPHQKPLLLQNALIEATTQVGDFVLDPCAGSFSVLKSCQFLERNFIGCDLK